MIVQGDLSACHSLKVGKNLTSILQLSKIRTEEAANLVWILNWVTMTILIISCHQQETSMKKSMVIPWLVNTRIERAIRTMKSHPSQQLMYSWVETWEEEFKKVSTLHSVMTMIHHLHKETTDPLMMRMIKIPLKEISVKLTQVISTCSYIEINQTKTQTMESKI